MLSDTNSRLPALIERFEKLYASTKGQLFSFIKKSAGPDAPVEDIVQECYIRIWEKLPTIQDDEKILPLLRLYAKTVIIDRLRKISKEKIRAEKFHDAHPLLFNSEKELEIKELWQACQETIAAMPQQRRTIYRLVREEGLSHQQVAKLLNISTHTIERHINKALHTLRGSLGDGRMLVLLIILLNGR